MIRTPPSSSLRSVRRSTAAVAAVRYAAAHRIGVAGSGGGIGGRSAKSGGVGGRSCVQLRFGGSSSASSSSSSSYWRGSAAETPLDGGFDERDGVGYVKGYEHERNRDGIKADGGGRREVGPPHRPVPTRPRSFFDGVNSRMERTDPKEYARFVRSEARARDGWRRARSRMPTRRGDGGSQHRPQLGGQKPQQSRPRDGHDSHGDVGGVGDVSSLNKSILDAPSAFSWGSSPLSSFGGPRKEVAASTSSVFSSISASVDDVSDGDDRKFSAIFGDRGGPSSIFATTPKGGRGGASPSDPDMAYDPIQFEAYARACEEVLSSERISAAVRKWKSGGKKKLRGKNVVEGGGGTTNSLTEEETVEMMRSWLLSEVRVFATKDVRQVLTSLGEARIEGLVVNESSPLQTKQSEFLGELAAQRAAFRSKLNIPAKEDGEDGRDDEGNRDGDEHFLFHHLVQYALHGLAGFCARRARPAPLEVAWHKVKESGVVLNEGTISTYLYVAGTTGGASGSGGILGVGGSGGIAGGGGGGITLRSMLAERMGTMPGDDRDGAGAMGADGDKDSIANQPDGDEESGDGDADRDDDRREVRSTAEEVATYHDLLYRPTEKSVSLRVKALVSRGEAKGAEQLLEAFKEALQSESKSSEVVRLRTYLPIFTNYCEQGDVAAALSLFKRMQLTAGVFLEPENYVSMLATAAENGCFREDSKPIDGALDLAYQHASGPGLLDELAAEMAEDALEITSASARRLYNALAVGFEGRDISSLVKIHPLASVQIEATLAGEGELVASRVALNRSTGICPRTSARQRLIQLEKDERCRLHNDLLGLAKDQADINSARYRGHQKRDNAAEFAVRELKKFSHWLDNREGEPFTAIVDGPNVAYYMQNFDRGKFNFHQLKFMVDTLEKRGENPLVVLPNKYGKSLFYSSRGERQKLSRKELDILQNLIEGDKLYLVPPRCLDDYYWMLASISDQTNSRDGCNLYVSTDDAQKRWPGTRPMLVSNDQMRDHKLELLEPRLFRRWFGCHIVNYNFTAFVNDECIDSEIGFSQADFFSREIQSNPSPPPPALDDDKERSSEWIGQAWHFPVSDWDLDDRFVVRIPKKKDKPSLV